MSDKTSDMRLKNCPFCGGEAEFYRTPVKINGRWCDSVVVRCKNCKARTNRVLYDAKKHPNDEEYNEAAAAWNARQVKNTVTFTFAPMQKISKDIAEKALDEFEYEGKSIRQWVEVLKDYDDKQTTLERIVGRLECYRGIDLFGLNYMNTEKAILIVKEEGGL